MLILLVSLQIFTDLVHLIVIAESCKEAVRVLASINLRSSCSIQSPSCLLVRLGCDFIRLCIFFDDTQILLLQLVFNGIIEGSERHFSS